MIISLITVKNLTLAYGDKDIVDGLSFSLTAGDFLVVIGDNGVGKTTLVRALLGQLKPKKGTIAMQEKLKIGYVPQFRNLDEEYPLSIKDFVALNAGKSLRPWLNKKERQHLKQILELTDLIRIRERQLGQASG
ncbi:ATP-binding cassette domain-containing protein, partial [Limosilactobacillus mucosae]|nr:ATP-binding cassette domain-containing protein [Limosilactobacillus mucosae]